MFWELSVLREAIENVFIRVNFEVLQIIQTLHIGDQSRRCLTNESPRHNQKSNFVLTGSCCIKKAPFHSIELDKRVLARFLVLHASIPLCDVRIGIAYTQKLCLFADRFSNKNNIAQLVFYKER